MTSSNRHLQRPIRNDWGPYGLVRQYGDYMFVDWLYFASFAVLGVPVPTPSAGIKLRQYSKGWRTDLEIT